MSVRKYQVVNSYIFCNWNKLVHLVPNCKREKRAIKLHDGLAKSECNMLESTGFYLLLTGRVNVSYGILCSMLFRQMGNHSNTHSLSSLKWATWHAHGPSCCKFQQLDKYRFWVMNHPLNPFSISSKRKFHWCSEIHSQWEFHLGEWSIQMATLKPWLNSLHFT